MPGLLQRRGLGGPAAGDERDRRARSRGPRRAARARSSGGHEAEDADAPRPVAEQLARSRQQRARPRSPRHQGQREERQAAALGDRRGERGAVADPGHRALGDRVAGAVGGAATPRARRQRRRWPRPRRGARRWRCARPGRRRPTVVVALGERRRRSRVLADGHEVGAQVGAAAGGDLDPGPVSAGSACAGRSGRVKTRMPADDRGLAAVHGGDRRRASSAGSDSRSSPSWVSSDDAGATAGDARGGGVQADAAAEPRPARRGRRRRWKSTNARCRRPPAGLAALGDQPGGAGGDGGLGLGERGHLDDDAARGAGARPGSRPGGHQGRQVDVGALGQGQHHDREVGCAGPQLDRGSVELRSGAQPAAPCAAAVEVRAEPAERGEVVDVEQSGPSGATRRGDQARVLDTARVCRNDLLVAVRLGCMQHRRHSLASSGEPPLPGRSRRQHLVVTSRSPFDVPAP